MTRFVIVGAGIVGLATARALGQLDPRAEITVVEKEPAPARHQTGRNSGVIHSGIYYKPGSAKAAMCRAGAVSMAEYARAHDIDVRTVGKLIVATEPAELPQLDGLYERGQANGVAVRRIDPTAARAYEPYVSCVGALRVDSGAIVDYSAVCAALEQDIVAAGGQVLLNRAVTAITSEGARTTISTPAGELEADVLINCAGLQSDRIAALDGVRTADHTRIVPFRGEYFTLRPERAYLVKGLIYPVPDPQFPFLGVHLTKMIDGSVHAGPNAVLALAREGYRWRTIRPADVKDTLTFPGFWQLARRHYRSGLMEMARSVSRSRFAASLARLVPEITEADLQPTTAGVRAQAVQRDGSLVDDFLIERQGRNVHVLNAPSPAATCALEIGRHVAGLATAPTVETADR